MDSSEHIATSCEDIAISSDDIVISGDDIATSGDNIASSGDDIITSCVHIASGEVVAHKNNSHSCDNIPISSFYLRFLELTWR